MLTVCLLVIDALLSCSLQRVLCAASFYHTTVTGSQLVHAYQWLQAIIHMIVRYDYIAYILRTVVCMYLCYRSMYNYKYYMHASSNDCKLKPAAETMYR